LFLFEDTMNLDTVTQPLNENVIQTLNAQTTAETRRDRARLTSKCWKPLLLASFCSASLSSLVGGQTPSLFPFDQSSRQNQTTGFPGWQSGASRACTPAEYGDPSADCIPTSGQPGYNPYNDFGAMDSTGDGPIGSRSPRSDQSLDMSTDARANRPASVPPVVQKEPPTEFQRYVAGSIGRLLPIFGASLFERVPATFAPVDHTPVGADYQIAPGDQLQVSIWGQFNLSRRLLVDSTGQIILPESGPLSVAGMNYSQAASAIKSALTHLYKNFDVNVTLTRLHSIQIFVVGEARRPGSYTVSSLSTLVNAIFACGGPSSRGSMRSIQLKRGDQTVRDFDLYQLLVHGDKSKDSQLLPGDVLFIPPAGPRVAVAGIVNHPGIYEFKVKTTLAEALQFADGLSPLASLRQVLLERINDGSTLQVRHVSLREEDLQTELHNGDIVRLLPVIPRFQNAITLRGNVADSGRFPWHDGMRISDLIPNQESLLTRDYWNGRNALGDAEEPAGKSDVETLDSPPQVSAGGPTPPVRQAPEIASLASDGLPAGSFQEQKRDTHSDASLGAASGLEILPRRTFNPRYTVQPAVPEINWDYAVVERTDPTTLATSTLPFSLGKLVLSHDSAQDLELRPGDVVTIFSKADFAIPRSHQATEVRIEGEVAMAGIYSVRPGESLRQLVARAGGLTSDAYLYGAQFTRESTRREQQKRYDDFLNQLERQMNEAASNLSSRVTSPQQAATTQMSLASQRDLVERLRKTSLNGRIVLSMDRNAGDLKSLPDLPLEDGDRLYVPGRPSTVNVIGDVLEQGSFLYKEDYRVGGYLKEAGGTSRSADSSHMFVIRADGSVVSRHVTSPVFGKGFNLLPMFPGDTLIVPTYINRSTLVRGLIDWSQIISNFALGAAAVNILR
jgi:polysaccharide export outer membrane protein